MTKKVAVINDLSGLGRCSLTAAISVLSAMGIQACPLPTAILSSQTEYPSYYCYDFTDKMDYFRQEWKKLGTSFSGIYTGYVASVCQIEQIMHFLDTFQTADTFLLVDPVMGDDGVTYDMYTSGLLTAMKELAARADVITPNLTEFCLLTDIDYNSPECFHPFLLHPTGVLRPGFHWSYSQNALLVFHLLPPLKADYRQIR